MVIVAFKPPLIKLKGRKAGMSNHHLRNKELTLKAKGLLSQMLSLPEDWDYTLAGLSYINRESIDAISTALIASPKALKSYCGTGLFDIIIHHITFYCSPFFLDMSTLFYQLAKIIHTDAIPFFRKGENWVKVSAKFLTIFR